VGGVGAVLGTRSVKGGPGRKPLSSAMDYDQITLLPNSLFYQIHCPTRQSIKPPPPPPPPPPPTKFTLIQSESCCGKWYDTVCVIIVQLWFVQVHVTAQFTSVLAYPSQVVALCNRAVRSKGIQRQMNALKTDGGIERQMDAM